MVQSDTSDRSDTPSTATAGQTPPLDVPGAVAVTRTEAPREAPDEEPRGFAVRAPYDETFIHDLKTTLPEWGRTWNGSAWIVDDIFAEYLVEMLWHHYG